jgi:phosphoglycolate phosphatase
MRRYDLVIFDLDGTLADTRADLVAAANHTMRALELPEHAPERVASFVGRGLRVLLARALGPRRMHDADLTARALQVFTQRYREHMLDATRPYPGMLEVLDQLGAAGVRLAVATNKPAAFTYPMVEVLFPGRFAAIIACADDVPVKPDPACVELCRAAGPTIPLERVLFVGDSDVDVETARNAKVDALAVTWGFQSRERLLAEGPRWIRDDVHQIADVVGVESAGPATSLSDPLTPEEIQRRLAKLGG